MPTNNEAARRKATLTALGATGKSNNETEFNKSLNAALTKLGKNKPEIQALNASSTAAQIVAALKA